MIEVFESYMKRETSINDFDLEKVKSIGIVKRVKRWHMLLKQDEVCKYYYFVIQGCLRMYRSEESGAEHILRFAIETWWMIERESLASGLPSLNNIDALEDSQVLLFPKVAFEKLVSEIPSLQCHMSFLLARSFNAAQHRIYTQISHSAEEKYFYFVKTYPEIFNRVPLHMIASYLGVSAKTLTRIRNNFSQKLNKNHHE